MEYVTLRNGVQMPMLGYGVYQVSQEECERCVLEALEVGYRALDTAQSYFNEEQVGSAMVKSGVPRKDIFLTTKVWIEHYGYGQAKASVLESMEKLQTDYLDLVLLHQPFADYYGAYRALEDMAAIAVLDQKRSAFFSHQDPAMVEWFVKMVEERKHQHDASREKKSW